MNLVSIKAPFDCIRMNAVGIPPASELESG